MSPPIACWSAGLDTTLERSHKVLVTRTLRGLVSPAIGLLVLGLVVNLFSREEVYANLEYGFPMLALFGAAGCIGQLTVSISRRSGTLVSACCIPTGDLPAEAERGGVTGDTGALPVLIALLFGPLVVLLAGLGGWV